MPVQTKRTAASMAKKAASTSAGEPKAKAKRRQEDPRVSQCDEIISLMDMAEGHKPETLQMLSGAAQSCLAVPKEQRHLVQEAVIDMIAEVLGSIETGHVAKVDALRSKIAEADTEKVARDAAAEAAASKCKDMSDAVEAADSDLKDARASIVAAKEEIKSAIAAQKEGDNDLEQAGGKKASAEAFVSTDLAALKDGTAADTNESVESLTKVAQELRLEAQLVSSAQVVLRQGPAARGAFDAMVIQQLEEQFSTAIAKLAEQLATGEAGKAARAATVEQCQQRGQDAAARRASCEEQLQAAKAAQKEAEVARKAAEKSVLDFGPDMEAAAADAESADAVLVACRADLTTFRELVEGPPAAGEAAAAETGEAAAAETAVAAEAEP